MSTGRPIEAPAGAAAAALVGLLSVTVAAAQSSAPPAGAAPQPAQAAPAPASRAAHAEQVSPHVHTQAAAPVKHSTNRHHPDRFAGRAGLYYRLVWGVDSLAVKWGESGEVIRFTYQVLDADKAKALSDKKFEPSLIDPQAGVKLVVPYMENVGQLRQSAPPEAGKSYWMVFSNKGRLVKRGDHVSVVIGAFHADGLMVD